MRTWPTRLARCAVVVFVAGAVPRESAGQLVVIGDGDIEWVDADWAGRQDPSRDGEVAAIAKASGRVKVIGTDERENVGDTTAYPWRTIGRLIGTFYSEDGRATVVRGTGVLIGRKTVLTSGHAIADKQRWASDVTFAAGKDGANEPYGRVRAVKLKVMTRYWNDEDAEYDLGLLVLEEALGDKAGHMPIDPKPASYLADAVLNIAGYPADLGNTVSLYYAHGASEGVHGNVIYHRVDTGGGESGAPVWVYNQGQDDRQLVGVHVRGGSTRNFAIHINDDFFNWINEYLKENDTVFYSIDQGASGSTSDRAPEGSPVSGLGCGASGIPVPAGLVLLAVGVIRPTRRGR